MLGIRSQNVCTVGMIEKEKGGNHNWKCTMRIQIE